MVPEQFRDAVHGQPNLLEFGGVVLSRSFYRDPSGAGYEAGAKFC
jgi:hypothetical protein